MSVRVGKPLHLPYQLCVHEAFSKHTVPPTPRSQVGGGQQGQALAGLCCREPCRVEDRMLDQEGWVRSVWGWEGVQVFQAMNSHRLPPISSLTQSFCKYWLFEAQTASKHSLLHLFLETVSGARPVCWALT
jgi:hypothetical protein